MRCSINDVTLLEFPKIIIQDAMANGSQSHPCSCPCPGFLEQAGQLTYSGARSNVSLPQDQSQSHHLSALLPVRQQNHKSHLRWEGLFCLPIYFSVTFHIFWLLPWSFLGFWCYTLPDFFLYPCSSLSVSFSGFSLPLTVKVIVSKAQLSYLLSLLLTNSL